MDLMERLLVPYGERKGRVFGFGSFNRVGCLFSGERRSEQVTQAVAIEKQNRGETEDRERVMLSYQ